MQDVGSSANSANREFVAFRVGAQEFCIDIMGVREIRGWTPATPLPHAPAYVRGVINLRGAVLPIVDLAMRFGIGLTEPTARSVIIVVQVYQQVHGEEFFAEVAPVQFHIQYGFVEVLQFAERVFFGQQVEAYGLFTYYMIDPL